MKYLLSAALIGLTAFAGAETGAGESPGHKLNVVAGIASEYTTSIEDDKDGEFGAMPFVELGYRWFKLNPAELSVSPLSEMEIPISLSLTADWSEYLEDLFDDEELDPELNLIASAGVGQQIGMLELGADYSVALNDIENQQSATVEAKITRPISQQIILMPEVSATWMTKDLMNDTFDIEGADEGIVPTLGMSVVGLVSRQIQVIGTYKYEIFSQDIQDLQGVDTSSRQKIGIVAVYNF